MDCMAGSGELHMTKRLVISKSHTPGNLLIPVAAPRYFCVGTFSRPSETLTMRSLSVSLGSWQVAINSGKAWTMRGASPYGEDVSWYIQCVSRRCMMNISDTERSISSRQKLSCLLFSFSLILVLLICSGHHHHVTNYVFRVRPS